MNKNSKTFKAVGKRVNRLEGKEKVCGTSKYIKDLEFEDMVYVAIATANVAHGILKSIGVEEAKASKGVIDVLTYEDVPGKNEMGDVVADYPALLKPGDKIAYVGDYVAYVAAESPELARKAAKKVHIEYEELSPVFDIDEAMRDKIVIHGDTNIKTHYVVKKGEYDPEKMFEGCDLVLENEFFADYQEQAYLEPQGVIAVIDLNNTFTVYGSMQCPYYVQNGVAEVLGIPYSDVRVIQTETGGAFGGKEDVPTYFAVPAALVANKLKRPAKLCLDREEDLQLTSKRHPIKSRYKVGVTDYGRIRALRCEAIGDMGGHGTLSPIVLWRSVVHAAGAYDIKNVSVDVYGVYTNKVPCGAYRGFGSPQVFFGIESMLDQIAQELKIDRLHIRQINALEKGKTTPTGHLLNEDIGAKETITKIRERADWERLQKEVDDFNKKHKYVKRGLGVSHIHYGVALGAMGQRLDASGAFVQVFKDGTIGIQIGGTEMGQGAKTTMALIASEILGQDISKIRVYQPDTAFVPDSGPTVASRTTLFSGNAVKLACEQLLIKMKTVAASHLNLPKENIIVNEKGFCDFNNPDTCISFHDVAQMSDTENEGLSATGWFKTPKLHWDAEKGFGEAYVTYSFATNVVLVEVDILTAHVQVLKVFASHDVGRAINLDGIYGQVQGGFVQGMGYALYEALKHDDKGNLLTTNFNTLTIPTIQEMPEFEIEIVEVPFSKGPFGAKGIGEPSLIPAPAAIANAVSHAIGKRITQIPITKDYLLKMISES
ncbi:MAG: xanthine dehydrogenase family protein molybdopterin-binding subunit [Thermotogota bacterium]|nr:xanthine dehydrogenase family protein molybdopterin-binding subunit [Thermotogota bacterium]